MKKLLVFDWNGTLLSDTNACMEADNLVLKTFGGKPVNLKTYRDTIIIPAINFYTQHGCSREEIEKRSSEVGRVFQSFYEPRVSQCRTRRGARKLLKWAKQNSMQSIILSNHTVTGINSQLKRLRLEDLILEVLANQSIETSIKNRNKGQKLEDYLKEHPYKPKDVFIVGDSPEEVEIGKSLGIVTAAITNGYYSEARLKAAKPDYLIHDLNELQKIIKF